MKWSADRIAGVVIGVMGVALAIYSFPFVTWVAFTAFLVGIVGIGMGVWLLAGRRKVSP